MNGFSSKHVSLCVDVLQIPGSILLAGASVQLSARKFDRLWHGLEEVKSSNNNGQTDRERERERERERIC